jgi:hypothetical protein
MRSLPIILTALLIVIVNPYEGINYEESTIYEYDVKCHDNCIGYTESNGWEDEGYGTEEIEEEEDEEIVASKNEQATNAQLVQVARQIILLYQPIAQ